MKLLSRAARAYIQDTCASGCPEHDEDWMIEGLRHYEFTLSEYEDRLRECRRVLEVMTAVFGSDPDTEALLKRLEDLPGRLPL